MTTGVSESVALSRVEISAALVLALPAAIDRADDTLAQRRDRISLLETIALAHQNDVIAMRA
jgi:hypothetical protein